MAEKKLSYVKNDFKGTFAIVKDWTLYEGDKGCNPLDLVDVCLRMDNIPPPLPGAPTQPATTSSQSQPKAPKTFEKSKKSIYEQIKDQIAEEQAKKKIDHTLEKVPPFDIRDVPKAMEAMGWSTASKLARKWLDGRSYDAYLANQTTGKIEERKFYDKDMIDTDTITLSWLLKQRGMQSHFENLESNAIHKDGAIKVAKAKFKSFLNSQEQFSGNLDTFQYCDNDMQKLHNQFQFQREFVSTWDGMSVAELQRKGMTEVTAALGAFNFYAAIAKAHIASKTYSKYNTPSGTQYCTHSTIQATHIYVYIRDSYSFRDQGDSSQYLGHWNKSGVIPLIGAFIADQGLHKEAFSEPHTEVVDLGNKLKEEQIFYSLRNRDYLKYKEKHKRGGDFVIYSDLKLIKLEKPIVIDMGEICY